MYRKKRKFYKKRRFNKGGFKKLRRDVKILKKGIEYKYKDTVISSTDVHTTATVKCLNALATTEREGQEVYARRLAVRGQIYNNRGTPVDCVVRIIIFRELQPNNTLPTGGLLLNAFNVNEFRNMAHKDRYKVYYDQTFTMDTTQYSVINFKYTKKLQSVVRYNGTAGTYADIEKNGLYMLVFSTVVSGADNPQVTGTARFSYNDN